MRFGTYWSVDLRGAFGPDAPGAAASAVLGPFTHPYPLHPIAIGFFSLILPDPVVAARLLSLLCGVAIPAFIWSMARSLGGEHPARAAGTVAAVAPLLVHSSLMGGGDAFALAIATGGAALALRAACRHADGDLRWGPAGIVLGSALVGLSAAAKPVALPLLAILPVAPTIGGRRSTIWTVLGMILAGLLASPFLGPLVAPQAEMGLLGSWWSPAPPHVADLGAWLAAGIRRLVDMGMTETWWLAGPILFLALIGAFMNGWHSGRRQTLFVLGAVSLVLTASILGDRLRPRYLSAATIPWLILVGWSVLPLRLRRNVGPLTPTFLRKPSFIEAMPLSLVMTLMLMSALTWWDGLARMRVQEEGTAPPRGWTDGWTEGELPPEDYRESSVCGALELERIGRELASSLPQDAVVAVVPLRDGRSWHLKVAMVERPDILIIELDPGCCPDRSSCVERLPEALASTGGALVGPLDPEGRCKTGALAPGMEALSQAIRPLLDQPKTWYGVRIVNRDPQASAGELCTVLGGQPSEPPAPVAVFPWRER